MNATTTKVAAEFLRAAEAFAHQMADDNNVETAWFLRGFAARLTMQECEDVRGNLYAGRYLAGWTAAGFA